MFSLVTQGFAPLLAVVATDERQVQSRWVRDANRYVTGAFFVLLAAAATLLLRGTVHWLDQGMVEHYRGRWGLAFDAGWTLLAAAVAAALVGILFWLRRISEPVAGGCVCSACNARFSREAIDQHAEKVARISSARVAEMFGTSDVVGTIVVFKDGMAYCPSCVTSVADLSQVGRSVRRDAPGGSPPP